VRRGTYAFWAIAAFELLLQNAPAGAQNLAHAWTWCFNKDQSAPDLQIGGCTAVIQSGKVNEENLSIAFLNRGNGYFAKKDYDSAIANYGQAIKLNPRSSFALHHRGGAYYFKKDYDRALADYSEAIRLNPKYFEAFNDRGLVYEAKGDFARAISDFDTAVKLNPSFVIAQNNRDAAYKAKGEAAKQSGSDDTIRAIGKGLGEERNSRGDQPTLKAFADVFSAVQANYVDTPDGWKLVDAAIQGLLKQIGLASPAIDENDVCKQQLTIHSTASALECFGRMWVQAQKIKGLLSVDVEEAANTAMVASLDSHSSYYDPKTFRDLQVQTRGEFGGIGIEVEQKNG
jgi:tetratricopeptide (TPR) repeat protein